MLGTVAGAAIAAGCVGTGKTTVEEEAEHSAHVCLDSHRHPVRTKPAVCRVRLPGLKHDSLCTIKQIHV